MKTMKHTMFTLLIAVAVIFTATSCSKDDDGGGGGDATEGTVKGKVDGTLVTSTPQLTTGTVVNAGGTSTVSIQGTNMDGKGFNFTVNGFEGVGSYNIGGGANVFVVANYIEGNASNPAATKIWTAPFDETVAGEINVSESSSTNIKGTFEFTGKNDDGSFKVITEGSFNVNL